MNKILNEQILVEWWWTMAHKRKKLNKASEAFKKAHDSYIADEQKAIKNNQTDSSLLAAKKQWVVNAANNYKERQQAVKDKQVKDNNKIADKLVNNAKFARDFDFKSLSPEVSELYEQKMKDKKAGKTVTSKGDILDPKDLDALADKYIKESYISSIYFKKPILKEGFGLDSLKETYTTKEFFNVLQESIINFNLLKEEQIVNLIDKLGFEYLEEGKIWNKVKEKVKRVVAAGALAARDFDAARDARYSDFKSLSPEIRDLYEKKMEDKKAEKMEDKKAGKTVTSKGNVIDPKISSIYFKKPILKEGFGLDSLKETYTAKEFFNVLQESIINFNLLKEEQIVDLIDKLGFEYLEEGKIWEKVKRGAAIAALVGGGMLSGAGFQPAKTAVEANKDYIGSNHIAEVQQDTINKANEDRLAKFDLGTFTDEEKQKNKETIDKATAARDAAASDASTSKAKRGASTSEALGLGLGGLALAAGGLIADKKQKASVDRLLSSKNKEIEEFKKRVGEEEEEKETNPKQTKKQ